MFFEKKREAQNFIEVALLAVVVVVAALYILGLFNDQKIKLAGLSTIKVHTTVVNVNTMSSDQANKKIATKKAEVETAGALSLKLLGMSDSEYQDAMNKLTYANLKDSFAATNAQGQNVASLANSLINQYGLSNTKITSDDISADTLNTLTDVLNQVSAKGDKSSTATAYIERLQALMKAAS